MTGKPGRFNIIQLSGHKNLQSMTNYSVVSEKKHVKMSRTLSELMSRNVHNLEKTNLSQVGECSTEIPSASSAAEHHQQAMSLFTGAVHGRSIPFMDGQFSISIKVPMKRNFLLAYSKEVSK